MKGSAEDIVVNVYRHPTKIWATVAVDPYRYIVVYGAIANPGNDSDHLIRGCNARLIAGQRIRKQQDKVWKGYASLGTFKLQALGNDAIAKVQHICFTESIDLLSLLHPDNSTAGVAKPKVLLVEPLAPNRATNRPWVF